MRGEKEEWEEPRGKKVERQNKHCCETDHFASCHMFQSPLTGAQAVHIRYISFQERHLTFQRDVQGRRSLGRCTCFIKKFPKD